MYSDQLAQNCPTSPPVIRQPDLVEKLQSEVSFLKERLAEAEDALAALTQNPELEKIFRAVSKVSHRL